MTDIVELTINTIEVCLREGWPTCTIGIDVMPRVLAALRAPADEITSLRAERDRLREALSDLLGLWEIAAVMPETIGKPLVLPMDCDPLNRARAALSPAGTPASPACPEDKL